MGIVVNLHSDTLIKEERINDVLQWEKDCQEKVILYDMYIDVEYKRKWPDKAWLLARGIHNV